MTSVIQHLEIKKLKPLQNNPRKIDKNQFAKLCENIQKDPEFFECRPCLVTPNSDGTYTIYAGNQRYRAAKNLHWKKIPCIITEVNDEAIIRRRTVLDNVHHGDFDYDLLSSLYDPNELLQMGMREKDLHIDTSEGAAMDASPEEENICPACNQKIKKKKS